MSEFIQILLLPRTESKINQTTLLGLTIDGNLYTATVDADNLQAQPTIEWTAITSNRV